MADFGRDDRAASRSGRLRVTMFATAKAAAVLYAKDPPRVALFYRNVVGFAMERLEDDFTFLDTPLLQLTAVAMPGTLPRRSSSRTRPSAENTRPGRRRSRRPVPVRCSTHCPQLPIPCNAA